jgi:signal transduction histidine kinase/GAF domain-containing protein
MDPSSLTGAVATQLLASADPSKAARLAIVELADRLRADAVFLARPFDGGGAPWHLYASTILEGDENATFAPPAEVHDTGRAAILYHGRVSALPPSPVGRHLTAAGMQSLTVVPLRTGEELLGTLVLAGSDANATVFADVASLSAVGSVLATWLRQVRSGERENVAIWRYCVIREAAQQLEAGLPLRDLLYRLVQKACELTGARYGALGVLDVDGKGLADFIYVGVSETEAARIGHLPRGRGLLGALLTERSTIRVARIDADQRSCGFPPNHPEMTSFLGVPLRIDGHVFGNFYLTDKHRGPEFTTEDEETIEVFAAHAALLVAYGQAADMATRERALLSAVVKQTATGVLFCKSNGEFGFANPAADRIAGCAFGREQLGEDAAIHGLRRPGGGEFSPAELPGRRALAGEYVCDVEAEIHRPDDHVVPIQINAVPVRIDGDRIVGAVIEFHDRTAAHELERLREEFTAVVAHDFRSPISSILARTQLLLERRERDQVTVAVTTVESIRRCAERLNQMTNDLLDSARIESARMTVHRQPVALPAAIERVLNQLRPTLARHAVQVHFEGELPPIDLDPLRFEQILTNLLENAAKYSPANARIDIDVRASGAGTSISVRDYGMGIEAEEMPRLFNRFYQTRRARAQKTGLGLGLFITKGLVEAHGGSIRVDSVQGQGTTFHVWFPSSLTHPDDLHSPQ